MTSAVVELGPAGHSSAARVALFSDLDGSPGPLLADLGVLQITNSHESADYTFSPTTPVLLNPSTTYWMGLGNATDTSGFAASACFAGFFFTGVPGATMPNRVFSTAGPSPGGNPPTAWYLPCEGKSLLFAINAEPIPSPFIHTTNNGTITITGYTGPGADVTIPATITGLPVTSIGGGAFSNCTTLTNITITGTVTSIGAQAFALCFNLTNVTIPTSVTSIGDEAFRFCTNLFSLLLPSSITTIGDWAFYYCTTPTSLVIPESVTTLGTGAFSCCVGLKSIKINNRLTNLPDWAFSECETLPTITIPDNITTLGYGVFSDCLSLTNVTLPDGLTSVGALAFDSCSSLTSIAIPNRVTTIATWAFGFCSLTNVMIGTSVTSVEDNAFWGCPALENVTLPESVTSIGRDAFGVCVSLKRVCFKGNAPSVASHLAYNSANAIFYYLPWTTGWGPTYGGRPTAVWSGQIQPTGPNFGVRTNQFGFNISGTNGYVTVIETCTNLASPAWSPVQTNTFTGTNTTSYFSDPAWTNSPARFYRLRSP